MKKNASWYALGALALAMVARAVVIVYNSPTFVNESALAYNNTYVADLQASGVGALSAQAVYSSATVAAQTFQDGRQSTGSFTVVSNAGLSALSASNNFTVTSTSNLTGASITVPGYVFYNGIDWAVQATSSQTAASIALALHSAGLLTSQAANSAIVYATAPAAGTYYNSWTMSSNNANLTVATPNFTGGQNHAIVQINGVRLKASRDWSVGGSAAASASNIATAINANSVLHALMSAQAIGSVITATSTVNGGVNAYALLSSTPAVTASGAFMVGAANADFALGGHSITSPSNAFTLALPVLYSTGSNLAIGGLTNQTTYYAIPGTGSFMLSKYSTSAVAGVDLVTFTSTNTALTAHTYTLSPLGIAGIPSFKWQASNDGSNWSDVNVSSVTMGSTGTPYAIPPTNTIWSFGYLATRYLRLNVVAPTAGGIILRVSLVGTN